MLNAECFNAINDMDLIIATYPAGLLSQCLEQAHQHSGQRFKT